MNKFNSLSSLVNSVFASSGWIAETIPTYPTNFEIPAGLNKAIRLNVLASSSNKVSFPSSVSGQIIIDIFVACGDGPKPAYAIADTLDRYLSGKTLTGEGSLQTSESTLIDAGNDTADKSFRRFKYSVSFNYYGV